MKYEFSVPDSRQIDVVICTDMANEADDQYAVTQAILSLKFNIRGIIATHFGDKRFADSMEESYQECLRVAALLDFEPSKIYRGNRRELSAGKKTEFSEGAKFLAEAAHCVKDKLYVGVMGPLTDVGAALLLDDSIADKLHVVWTGTTLTMLEGDACREANARKDMEAFNIVMEKCRDFTVIPFEIYSQDLVSLAELQQKVSRCGEIGRYLFQELTKMNMDESRSWTSGESWCLGDNPVVGMLLNPRCGQIRKEKRYWLDAEHRPEKRMKTEGSTFDLVVGMNTRYVLEDFFSKLHIFAAMDS